MYDDATAHAVAQIAAAHQCGAGRASGPSLVEGAAGLPCGERPRRAMIASRSLFRPAPLPARNGRRRAGRAGLSRPAGRSSRQQADRLGDARARRSDRQEKPPTSVSWGVGQSDGRHWEMPSAFPASSDLVSL